MSKTRNEAAKILFEKGWTFEEVESVLIKKSARPKARIQKPKQAKPTQKQK